MGFKKLAPFFLPKFHSSIFFEYEIIFYLLAFIYIMNKNSGKRNFVIAFPEITYPLLSISGLALHEKFLWKDKSSPKYDWKNNFFCLILIKYDKFRWN